MSIDLHEPRRLWASRKVLTLNILVFDPARFVISLACAPARRCSGPPGGACPLSCCPTEVSPLERKKGRNCRSVARRIHTGTYPWYLVPRMSRRRSHLAKVALLGFPLGAPAIPVNPVPPGLSQRRSIPFSGPVLVPSTKSEENKTGFMPRPPLKPQQPSDAPCQQQRRRG